jgi:beta-glucanase (GH16 family)
MPSFTARIRTAVTVLVIAVAANFGIASASAKTSADAKSKAHHVEKHHVEKHHVEKHHVERAHRARHAKKHAKKHVKKHAKKQIKRARAASLNTPAAVTTQPATSGNSAPQPAGISGNWNLALNSEFNGSSLDTGVWHTGWFGSGVTSPVNSSEQDCYSPSNVNFPGDGSMHLDVTAQASTCGGVTKPYTGAMVTTNPDDGAGGGFQYTYGVLEARVYVPADGTQIADWPAVWTDGQSWPNDGEDDVMEGLGGTLCWHFHDPLGGPGACDKTIAAGWHTFASNWQPGSVTYYYDGVKVGSIATGITGSPMYVLLDNTVAAGKADVTTADSMQVQYVRVWQG